MRMERASKAGPGGPLRGLGPVTMMVVLGACASQGSGTSQIYRGMDSDRLYERTMAALQVTELEVSEADRGRGVIVASGSFHQRGWARCDDSLLIVDDQSSTQHMVEAREDHREVMLRATIAEAPEGARLTVEPSFISEPVSALATTEGCTTTGVLERRILDAAAEPAPS